MIGSRRCGGIFLLLHEFIERRKKTVLGCLLLVTLIAAASVPFLPFENKLDVMLPADAQLQRTVRLLYETDVAGKVVVSFKSEDGDVLRSVVDQFASFVSPPMITGVMAKISNASIMQDMMFFFYNAPQILGESDLASLEDRLDPESINISLRKKYLQLLKPGGGFMSEMIQGDPLDVNNIVLGRLARLQSSFGYDVNIDNGYLVSKDGLHILVVLDTDVSLTDGDGSRMLMAYLDAWLQDMPEVVTADVICGHSHTVSNEDVIKRDIKITLIIAGIAFFVLFLAYFRDPRAIFIFLLPAGAVLLSLNITALITGHLSGLVMGLGSVIAGIAIDYGIHVYVAVRRGEDVGKSVLEIARPVLLGSLTTISVFSAFMLSSIEGYRQLAWFSIISIVISLFYALCILPHCLKLVGCSDKGHEKLRQSYLPGKRTAALVVIAFVALLVAGIFAALGVRFDSDIKGLDGADESIVAAEARFQEVWGAGESAPAMLVVVDKDRAAAELKNEQVYRDICAELDADKLINFTSIWPPRKIREENLSRWNQFWSSEREDMVRTVLAEKGAAFSFSTNAFAPFFENIHRIQTVGDAPATNALFDTIQERFVQKHGDEWRMISFFPDTEEYLSVVDDVGSRYSGVFPVSRRWLSGVLSKLVAHEVIRISIVAMALILLVTYLLIGDIRMATIALAPAVAGVILLLATMSVFGISLNISNLIAGIVVVGLCIDYGIFMVYAYSNRIGRGAVTSVSLSAITTLVGAGVLIFARHPALFSIGLTLVVGVLVGYLTSMLVVSSLYVVFGRRVS